MARFSEPTPEQEAGWTEWVASRPDNVRIVAERFNPWTLYRLKDTDQRVTLVSFGEDDDGSVTLTVNVTGEFNLVTFERSVFGVDPASLEECDLPPAQEFVGAVFDEEPDIEQCIDALRPSILAACVANGSMTEEERQRILSDKTADTEGT